MPCFYKKGITLALVCGHRSIQLFVLGETRQGVQVYQSKSWIFDHPKGMHSALFYETKMKDSFPDYT
ncbi:MAG: hypothetical protein PWR20_656 [Bacteroidales bacterium]|jgi:hypothetical protein|nr:hypothetical protein [Bacteroidales bacterium]MDN5328799.1 hypothetical protein [Bacteroidales bacterium]